MQLSYSEVTGFYEKDDGGNMGDSSIMIQNNPYSYLN
jgi:hypothetical protein